MSLQSLFNKFAGREVNVIENPQTISGYSFTNPTLDKNDPTIAEIRAAAQEMGYTLRTHLPGHMFTCDYKTDRLNVGIAKEGDGKYRIQANSFKIG